MQDIHILTSTKGGVGKTLLTILTILHYYKERKSIIGVDLNTMNPDLFRILAFNKSYPISRIDWEKSEINANGIEVVRPFKPRSLPDGAIGFWRRVDEITSLKEYTGSDFILDTNLHVANLVHAEENKSPLAIIEHIAEHVQKIYIWIIWSWASFREIQPIYSSFDTLCTGLERRGFNDIVSIVHVLNPNAIVPPQTEVVTKDQMIVAVAEALTGLQKLASILGKVASADLLLNAVKSMRDTKPYTPESDYSVLGLQELALAQATSPLNLTGFSTAAGLITESIKENSPTDLSLFVPVNMALQKIILGLSDDDLLKLSVEKMRRPSNLLAIGTHDRRLSGYTDKFARRPAESMQNIIDEITPTLQTTVSNFLDHLTYVKPIEDYYE